MYNLATPMIIPSTLNRANSLQPTPLYDFATGEMSAYETFHPIEEGSYSELKDQTGMASTPIPPMYDLATSMSMPSTTNHTALLHLYDFAANETNDAYELFHPTEEDQYDELKDRSISSTTPVVSSTAESNAKPGHPRLFDLPLPENDDPIPSHPRATPARWTQFAFQEALEAARPGSPPPPNQRVTQRINVLQYILGLVAAIAMVVAVVGLVKSTTGSNGSITSAAASADSPAVVALQNAVASLYNDSVSKQGNVIRLENTITTLQDTVVKLQSANVSHQNTVASLENTITTLQRTMAELKTSFMALQANQTASQITLTDTVRTLTATNVQLAAESNAFTVSLTAVNVTMLERTVALAKLLTVVEADVQLVNSTVVGQVAQVATAVVASTVTLGMLNTSVVALAINGREANLTMSGFGSSIATLTNSMGMITATSLTMSDRVVSLANTMVVLNITGVALGATLFIEHNGDCPVCHYCQPHFKHSEHAGHHSRITRFFSVFWRHCHLVGPTYQYYLLLLHHRW